MQKERRLQDPSGKIEKTTRRVRDASGLLTAGFLVIGALSPALAAGAVALGANELYKTERGTRTESNKTIKDNKEDK